MVDVNGMVTVTTEKPLEIHRCVVYPIAFMKAMMIAGNLVLTQDVNTLLNSDKVSMRIFAEIVLHLEQRGMDGLPDWALLDLDNHKICKVNIEDPDLMQFYYAGKPEVIHWVDHKAFRPAEGGKYYRPPNVLKERDECMKVINYFVKGKLPFKVKSYIPSRRPVESNIPVEVSD